MTYTRSFFRLLARGLERYVMISDEVIKDVIGIAVLIHAYASTRFSTWMGYVNVFEPGYMPGFSIAISGGLVCNGM